MTPNYILVDYSLAQSSTESLPIATDRNKSSQIKCREWETLEHSVLNAKSLSNPSLKEKGNSAEEKAERA